MARRMECDRWLAPTSAAEEALALVQGERICGIMIDLAAKLGSYDLDAQLRGIDGAVESAKSLLYELEAERKLRSKTYKTLSICTGAAVAILLI